MSNEPEKPADEHAADDAAPDVNPADGAVEAATSDGDTDEPSSPTQAVRRTAFGLNVLVAVAAVVGLLVVLNWAANMQSHRFDLTATRQYSLSPQTRQLFNGLEAPYEMVTLFGSQGVSMSARQEERIQKARDLVDEYGRQSSNITVRHIDPDTQIDELRGLYKELHDRFATDIKPAREAVEQAMATLNELQTSAVDQAAALEELLNTAGITDADARRQFEQAKATFDLLAEQGATVEQTMQRSLDTPMPDYGGLLLQLQSTLSSWSTRALQPMSAAFDELANNRQQSNVVIDEALGMVDNLERTSSTINQTLRVMGRVKVPDDYTRLLTDSATAQTAVLVLGPQGSRKARFVALTDMFIGATRAANGESQEMQEQVFRGEELLTAAMIRMQMTMPPLAVFAYTGATPAIGRGGPYNALAERLQNAGFEVEQWNPMGQRQPGGTPTPPSPPPAPRANQSAVWIFPPLAQPQPNNPMPTGADRVAQLARDRMDAGDGVLLMVSYDPAARFNSTDPFVQMLSIWGIKADPGKLILHEVKVDDDRSQTLAQSAVRDWPNDLPITQALAGLPGFTIAGTPLTVAADKSEDVTVWPLIELREDRQWAESDFAGDTMPSYNAAYASEVFNVAMAAEHNGNRLVAISDPAFGMDRLLTEGRAGPGTADLTGAVFPANAELLVNSAYWLAHLDTLIAASARTQDIRRIDSMTPETQTTWRIILLAGLPALTVLVGLGVWLVRRRA